jgi:hypothetical protein
MSKFQYIMTGLIGLLAIYSKTDIYMWAFIAAICFDLLTWENKNE